MRMMKTLILIVLLAAIAIPQNVEDSLYARGLQACLEKELTSYARFSDRDLQNVIVAKDLYLTTKLPQKMGEFSIRYLNDSELAQEFKKLPKDKRRLGVPFIKIFPISDKNNKLYFAYNSYWFTYSEKGGVFSEKKMIFGHALEGGCHAEVGFDPIESKFVIKGANFGVSSGRRS